MAKKLCELCQKEYEKDMRMGVRLCQSCCDNFSKAISHDPAAVALFCDPQNFPDATESAKKLIVGSIVNRAKRVEEKQQEKQQEEYRQKVAEQKEQKRAAYAQSIGVTYKEKAKSIKQTSVDELYMDIGKKIKNWAKWIFIVEAIASVIGAVTMLFTAEDGWMIIVALLMLVIGPVLAWVSSWILYAFGELVDKTTANERNTHNILKLMLENNIQENKE